MSSRAELIRQRRLQAANGPSVLFENTGITVNPAGTVLLRVKLSGPPPRDVGLRVEGGSSAVSITAGARLVFTTDNWDTYQDVTISATADAVPGQATFQVRGPFVKTGTATVIIAPAAANIVIDPVTRIEGRLRVEVELNGDTISQAWSTAALFRGVENLLVGRDPQDAPVITQRVCGVCTYVHGLYSVEAIEDAAGVTIPHNARLVRNLLLGAQFLHDHIVHFYHLQGLDWIDVPDALNADPAATQVLAETVTPDARAIDFAAVQARLQGLVNTGNLGLFAGGHFGHPAYKFSSEENLLLAAHYLEALRVQVNAARMMAVLGGKNPHPAAMVPGGVTCGGELSKGRLNDFDAWLADTVDFVTTVMVPDAALLAARHPEYATFGGGSDHFVVGGFPLGSDPTTNFFLPGGVLKDGDLLIVHPVELDTITEDVARAWYKGAAQHPTTGTSEPNFTGLDIQDRYSWSKAPRYQGKPMEVGPLSRLLVSLALGQPQVAAVAQSFMNSVGWELDQLNSAMGRVAARVLESQVIAGVMEEWSAQLAANIAAGDDLLYVDWNLPANASGVGLGEVPRGALGHWLAVDGEGRIGNYQMVVPSTWNFGPRDGSGQPGPLEKSLEGMALADQHRPLEVLRMIHAFDPCIACGVHCVDVRSKK